MYHLFFFDGTQNGLDDQYPTNVRIMASLADMPGQKVHYFEGPGNDERNILEHITGSLFGADMWKIRDKAYAVLKREFQPGDKIAVPGCFSRGSSAGRKFCQKVAEKGIEIEFLGCFDTVFALLPFGIYQQETIFGNLHVSGMVKQARHALSIDEDRAAFAPNLMNQRPGIVERWFKGNHADIGGGYKERGLADVSLHWMLSEAHTAGRIDFKPMAQPEPLNAPHREKLPIRREKRTPVVMVDGKPSPLPVNLHQY